MKKLLLAIAGLSACVSQAQELQIPAQSVQNSTYLVKPDGEYSVGYHDVFWVNGTLNGNGQYECPNNQDPYYTGQNKDDFEPDNQTDFCREVVLRIYYPTQKNDEVGNTYPPLVQFYKDLLNDPSLPNDKFPPEKRQELINGLVLKSYTIADKNVVQDKKYPVVLFSHGTGANVQMYENSITNLVSHGYIVVGINSLFIGDYIALENGHLVHRLYDPSVSSKLKMREYEQKNGEFIYNKIITDSQTSIGDKILSEIYSSMDFTKMGVYGHSIGGSMAGDLVLAHPAWFQAVSTLDEAPDVKQNRPTRDFYPIPVLHQAALYSRYLSQLDPSKEDNDPDLYNLANDGYLVVYQSDKKPDDVKYSIHINFTDLSTVALQPSLVEYFNYINSISPELGTANGWEITHNMDKYLLKFFNSNLKNNDIDPNFGLCKPLTTNSKLICGPASGV